MTANTSANGELNKNVEGSSSFEREEDSKNNFATLSPSGGREVVDEVRASEIVKEWKVFLDSKKVVVNKVVLSNKAYTAGAAMIISDFISKNCAFSVKVAILSDVIASRMEEEGLQVLQILSDSLKNSELVEVDLSDNAMGSKGIRACTSVLGGQACSLERLTMCNNGLSETSMEELSDILVSGSDEMDEDNICERLTKIHFFNNMSGNKGCEAFARILSKTTDKLVDVRYSGTRAGREGSMILASALDNDTMANLKHLDLADNSFGTEGAQLLSRALVRCRNLTYLNLRDCVLADSGMQAICHAVFGSDSSETLQHLDVSGNDITAQGALSLSELLEDTTNLRVFYAEENEMTSRGIQHIAPLLPPSLQELRLGFNECGPLGAKALIQVSKSLSQNLHTLHLDGNSFPSQTLQNLMDTFGDKLIEMEDNEDENNFDDDLSDAGDNAGIPSQRNDSDMDQLIGAVASVRIDSQLC